MIKYLALDQSTNVSGFAIYHGTKLHRRGTFDFSKDKNATSRINKTKKKVLKLIKQNKIDFVILEDTFLRYGYGGKPVGVSGYATLTKNLGVLIDALYEQNVAFVVVHPKTWKGYCNIKGRKREEQKINTILKAKSLHNLRKITEDEADAIMIGWWAVNHFT